MPTETPDRIVRLTTVLDRTGLSRSTIYRSMQKGSFSKNLQIAERSMGWRESAISAWPENDVP